MYDFDDAASAQVVGPPAELPSPPPLPSPPFRPRSGPPLPSSKLGPSKWPVVPSPPPEPPPPSLKPTPPPLPPQAGTRTSARLEAKPERTRKCLELISQSVAPIHAHGRHGNREHCRFAYNLRSLT